MTSKSWLSHLRPHKVPFRRRFARASVALIFRSTENGGKELLFIQRARREGDPWSGDMAFPGGRLQPEDASARAAAERETLEETGWHVQLTHLVGVYTYLAPNGVTYYRFCFAVECIQQEPNATLDEGIIGPVWLDLDEIQQRKAQWRSPLLIQCIEDYAQGKRYPLDLIYEHPIHS